MKIYLRIISLVLAILMMLTFVSCDLIPGFQNDGNDADNNDASNGNTGDDSENSADGCEHFYLDGVCRLCSLECKNHEWRGASCIVCDKLCSHPSESEGERNCSVCGTDLVRFDTEEVVEVTLEIYDSSGTYEHHINRPMSLNEMLGQLMPYSKYIVRFDVFDIILNGKEMSENDGHAATVTVGSELIVRQKSDAIAVNVTVSDGNHTEESVYLLSGEGMSIETLALLLFPNADSFNYLLSVSEIYLDGVQLTDKNAKIDKDGSTLSFVAKDIPKDPTPPPVSDLEYVGLRLTFMKSTGNDYTGEWEFYVKNGTTFSELIENAFHIDYVDFEKLCISIDSDIGADVNESYKITSLDKVNARLTVDALPLACTHSWDNGVCADCCLRCYHTWEDGVCPVCGYEEPRPDPESYSTATVSHKGQYIERYKFENGIMLSEFVEWHLGMSFDEFTVNQQYSMWVNEKKVSSDITLSGDVAIVYIDFTTSDRGPDMCSDHVWTDGVCDMCSKKCEHMFDGDTCEYCGYVSGGIDNPITIHFDGAEIPVPYSATFLEVVALYMVFDTDVEMSFINDEWAIEIDGERRTVGMYECPADYGRDVWLVYLGGDVYPGGGNSGSNPSIVYIISVIDDPAYVPFIIESDTPLSGEDIIQRAGIENPERFYIYVNSSEFYDLDSFKLMIFSEPTNIDFHLAG